ncbi:MAG: chorion class high-cysteine HCB protein 13 [Lachnospiraceae bacterium]|jgi:hypothetical protein
MSDLAATNCGCGCDDNCNGGCGRSLFGGDSCQSIIWILILLSCCGGSGWGMGHNDDCCGCGNNSCLWIIILLFFCNGGCNC